MSVTSTQLGHTALDCRTAEAKLAEGWTLPASLYTDPAVDRIEDQLIWRAAWQEVGVLADFRRPGDFLTAKLGRYPILVVRDSKGELRAFLNVCRHRGSLLVGGDFADQPDNLAGNSKGFTCRFHGWTYGLDGRLRGAPDRAQGKLPPLESLGLRPISVATWGGIVFVSIEPNEPLDAHLSDLPRIAEHEKYTFPFLSDDIEFAGFYEWQVNCNWKVFMEVNLECYHCPTTHAHSFASVCKLDHKNFRTVNFRNGNHLRAPFVDDLERKVGSEAARRLHVAAEQRGEGAFQQYWIWPNNMWTSGVGFGNALFRIDRTGPTTCRMVARVYLHKDDVQDRKRLDEFVKDVIAEDVRVTSGVQMGLESGARDCGPLLAEREESIRWFSAMVWSHIGAALR